jgi:hypothetical protein
VPTTSWQHRGPILIALVGVLVGTVLRIALATYRPALFLDEAMLALNVLTRPVSAIGRPLAFEQTAPVLFLLLAKVATGLAVPVDVALRATAVAAGIATVPLLWLAATSLRMSPAAAAAVTVAAALSPMLVSFSEMFKPYAMDAAVAALLIALTAWLAERPADRARWLACGIGAAVAPFASTPSVFVLVGVAGALVLKGDYPRRVAIVILAIASASVANYLLFQRVPATNGFLQHYWSPAFLWPLNGAAADRVRSTTGLVLEWTLFGGPQLPFAVYGLMAIAAVIGLVDRARHLGVWSAWLLGAPPAAALIAATARLYPLSPRTLVFAVPILILLAVDGLWTVARRVPPAVVALGAAALLVCPVSNAVSELRKLATPDSAAAGMATVRARAGAGDAIYIFGRDVASWTVATTNDWDSSSPRLAWYMHALTRLGPNPGNAPSRHAAVPDSEGMNLVWRGTGAAEVVGVPTGMEQIFGRFVTHESDTGWVSHESRRILALHPVTAWLFFTTCDLRPCDQQLADTLVSHGGQLIYRRADAAAAVYGVRFTNSKTRPD